MNFMDFWKDFAVLVQEREMQTMSKSPMRAQRPRTPGSSFQPGMRLAPLRSVWVHETADKVGRAPSQV